MVDHTLRRIFILAAIVGLIWILYLLKPVLLPFLGAFMIAYLFSPLVNKMSHLGIPRWLAITFVFLGIAMVVIWAVSYLVPLIWQQLMYAKSNIPDAIRWVNYQFLPWLSHTFDLVPMEIDTEQISTNIMNYIQANYGAEGIQSALLRVAQSGLNFIQIGGTIVLIPVITFYFLLDWERILERWHRLIPRPYEKSTVQIITECHQILGAFVKGQFLVMFLLGLIYAVGLQLIGLEVGLIIGMVAGLASIIPYLGFAVGIISAVIATFFQFGLDWMQLFLVGVVFLIGQVSEGYVLQPFLLGDKIGLSPVAVVFAVLAGAHLGGFIGMLIALPVAAVLVVLLRHLRNFYERTNIYGAQNAVIEMQPNVDIDLVVHDAKDKQQQTEKSSKIEPLDNND